MKTSELIDTALDWAVEFIEGGCKAEPHANYWLEKWVDPERRYLCESASTCWSHSGPIIEREKYDLSWMPKMQQWCAQRKQHGIDGLVTHIGFGTTPLIAAMRCYVASKLGDEVDIPEELQ